MLPAPMITLLTDFGRSDIYVGQMHAVMATIAPQMRIVDLTHDVEPQNVTQAACLLVDSVGACPAGTVHVVVVDPGVGSQRRAIAVEIGRWIFVAPDNGVLTAVLDRWQPGRAVELTKWEYHRQRTSATFHGRDLFGPVAAHLANGVEIDEVGSKLTSPLLRLELPVPHFEGSQICGEILWVDRFGNLITNVFNSVLAAPPDGIAIGSRTARWVNCYADGEPGELLAIIGSSGRLEIAMRNGSAQRLTGAGAGTRIILQCSS